MDATITNDGDFYLWNDKSIEGYMAQFDWLDPWAQNQNTSAQIEPGFQIDSRKLPPFRTRMTRMIAQLSDRAVLRTKQQGNMTRYGMPDYGDVQNVEAMMIYERGVILEGLARCNRCMQQLSLPA